jgi:hypothetical protein
MSKHAEQLRKARENLKNGNSINIDELVSENLPKSDIYDEVKEQIPVAKENVSNLDALMETSDKYEVKSEKVGAIYHDGSWGPAIQYSRLDEEFDESSSFEDALEYE